MSTPLKVYLDNADWAYLQEGKARQLEPELRRLGNCGAVAFLISDEHCVETAGLEGGLVDRLEYLRSFPCTYRLLCGTDDLLRGDADSLAAAARGESIRPGQIETHPLSRTSLSDLRSWVREFGQPVRKMHGLSASVYRRSRAARAERSAREIRSGHNFLSAFIRGDADEVVRRLDAHGQVRGRAHEWILRKATSAVGHTVGFLQARGFTPFPRLRFDPPFATSVIPFLRAERQRDPKLLDAVFGYWKTTSNRAVSPSLACYAALREAIYYEPDRAYSDSEDVDARHAAYAPLVDVFTCDKRSHTPLRRALTQLGRPTRVVRTRCHGELLDALQNS